MFSRMRPLLAGALLTAAVSLLAPATALGALPTINGSWSHLPNLPDGFTAMTGAGAEDNRLYLFGFTGIDTPATYRWNPNTNSWQQRAAAPAICSDAQAAALGEDNTIFLAGCYADPVNDPGFRVAAYDVASNDWTLLPGHGPFVSPIQGAALDDGRIFWFSQTLRKRGGEVVITGHRVVVQKLDGTFNSRAKQPTLGPTDGGGIGQDGHLYMAGGQQECQPSIGACHVPPVMEFNNAANNWTRPAALPTPRIKVAVTGDPNGRIWTIAGLHADGSSLYNTVEVYRPHSDSWAKAANLPDKRWAAQAAFTPNGRIWVYQGFDQFGNPLQDGYVFSN